MAIMVGDAINTPEGKSEITEILRKQVNQYAYVLIFFFANGVTAHVKKTRKDISNPMFDTVSNMTFKASDPAEAWTAGEYYDDNEECWC